MQKATRLRLQRILSTIKTAVHNRPPRHFQSPKEVLEFALRKKNLPYPPIEDTEKLLKYADRCIQRKLHEEDELYKP